MNNQIDASVLARIIDARWRDLQENCNTYQLRMLNALRSCRTPALGGHIYQCNHCKQMHYRYNSCRNRHCPQCQNTQKEQWIAARHKQLIHTNYFHLVFTIPHELKPLCLAYPRVLYAILFRSAWKTINDFGWNPKYIGAQTGATIVLHTWGSNLSFHPHVHCIVPGGGISLKNKWKNAQGKGKFIFPVKALSSVFKANFIKQLNPFLEHNGLNNTQELLKNIMSKKWVVYAKPPFGGAKGVIQYLARYTHKVAITHRRILMWDKQSVQFSYTDYRHANQKKSMTLDTFEFLRRFALHFLPKGFPRIRHYGILSSSWKNKIFPNVKNIKINWVEFWKLKGLDLTQCSTCKIGKLLYIKALDPVRGPPRHQFNNAKL